MPEPLTELERRILEYMVDYLRERTYQPSIREIGRQFGIRSTKTVSEYLQALANKGWIERDPSRSRGVRLLGVDLGALGEADRYPTVSGIARVRRGARVRAPGVPAGVAEPEGSGAPEPAPAPAAWGGESPAGVQIFEAVDGSVPDTGVRAGDLVYVSEVPAEDLVDGDAVAVREAAGVTVGRWRTEDCRGCVEWDDGRRWPVDPVDAPGLNLLGRALGWWRRIPGPPEGGETPERDAERSLAERPSNLPARGLSA